MIIANAFTPMQARVEQLFVALRTKTSELLASIKQDVVEAILFLNAWTIKSLPSIVHNKFMHKLPVDAAPIHQWKIPNWPKSGIYFFSSVYCPKHIISCDFGLCGFQLVFRNFIEQDPRICLSRIKSIVLGLQPPVQLSPGQLQHRTTANTSVVGWTTKQNQVRMLTL